MSDEVPPDVGQVLLLAALVLTVSLFAARPIDEWWRHSLTARLLRIRARSAWRNLTVPFRLLRKRQPKTTAGVRFSPTPAPAVPDDVEVARDADQ